MPPSTDDHQSAGVTADDLDRTNRATTPDLDGTGGRADLTFADLGLAAHLLAALDTLGYEEPTPIQSEAIPPALEGRDVLGQAATGTGKTAAFALPLLQRLLGEDSGATAARSGAPVALVLAPTRELAMQVSQAIHRYGRDLPSGGVRVVPIYGGQPIHRQLAELKRGVDIVVATPGRALDHLGRHTLRLDRVEVVVLDEADEMLDMGFAEDLEAILAEVPEFRQTMLFSATMPGHIERLARRHLHEPVRITLGQRGPGSDHVPRIRQVAHVVSRSNKPAALGRILDVEVPEATIVFCRTRLEVEELTEVMNGRGYRAEALHGGMAQQQRDRVMDRVRSETTELLIATDVAARGLDIDHLSHVINYDVPSAPEAYVHRIGRVGRAGREGVAITLVEPRQHRLLKAIERHTGSRMTVDKLPTVADLRARRMELVRASLREMLLDDQDLDRFRPVVASLSDEFDVMEIALAALAMAHDFEGGDDDQDLPEVALRDGDPHGKGDAHGKGGKGEGGKTGRKGQARPNAEMVRLWIGAGRKASIRPQDIVGAIANETSLSGGDIGNIQIAHQFSTVEVPADAADEVLTSLRQTTIRGRRQTIRRWNPNA